MTAFDRQLAVRAALSGAIALVVAAVVVASTDEGAGWAARAGLVAALAPVAGGVGASAALGVAVVRGEVRALAALGVTPARAAIGAAAGGAALALVGPLATAWPRVALGALFPRSPEAHAWVVDGAGLVAPDLGLRVGRGGAVTWQPAAAAFGAASVDAPRAWVAVALLLAALGAPAAACAPRSARRRALALGVAVVLAIGAFQFVAAGRAPAAWLAFAPAALLVDAAVAFARAARNPVAAGAPS